MTAYTPRSSDAAISLIVTEEDSGAQYYSRHYTHFAWPQGASGPTVGIGYDCGYSTAEQIKADWTGFVSDQTVQCLMQSAGIRGYAAETFVSRHGRSVTISWDQAIAQFKNHELKKWEDKLNRDLPNADQLSGDSFGALTSLIYNRGDGGFDSPGARYAEMRAIKAHMAAKEFAKIPTEFLSMRRLWPKGGGLWNRRTHEAQLFSRGLARPAPAQNGSPDVSPVPSATPLASG